MEVPTNISTARVMINCSSTSSGVSRLLVCSLCRSVYATGSLHTRQCSYVRFANKLHRQEQPCGNPFFIGSTVKPALEYPYNSIVETLKKFFLLVLPSSLRLSSGEVDRWRMVSFNEDWFRPSDGMHYSCRDVYLAINDFPRISRMKTFNIILVGMIPVPDDQLQNFLWPMIVELNTLCGGMMMTTYQNRNGEMVRVALVSVNCDIPAARKVAGFMGQSAHKACNKCSNVFSRISTGANSTKPDFSDFDDEHWILRNNTQQRQEAYSWLNATHITQQRTHPADEHRK